MASPSNAARKKGKKNRKHGNKKEAPQQLRYVAKHMSTVNAQRKLKRHLASQPNDAVAKAALEGDTEAVHEVFLKAKQAQRKAVLERTTTLLGNGSRVPKHEPSCGEIAFS